MLNVRVNSFADNNLGEPEQDANSALTELDKGLRSGKVGEQCEAIVRFPRLFEKYPFPILINSSMLKLADIFRVGNNFLRVWVLCVCQESEKHLDKILNVDEFIRRIHSVIHSNDPVARALTLRTLGSVAGIIAERQQVHHSVKRSLDSHDKVEVEAAIYAAVQFTAKSRTFAVGMCNKFSDMIRGLVTTAPMKLQLIPVLQHMHHNTSSAALVQELCQELLPSYPAKQFVIATLNSLTHLSSATLVDIPKQVLLLLDFLQNDPHWEVKMQVLKNLHYLAEQGAHLWPTGAVEAIINVSANASNQKILQMSLDVLQIVVKSSATCHSQLHPNSPLMELCHSSCLLYNPLIAAKSLRVMTGIVCYCSKDELTADHLDKIVTSVESLFLLLTSLCSKKHIYGLKICLQCMVSLCKHHQNLCPQFVELIGLQLLDSSNIYTVLLCEALGAIGGSQPNALNAILQNILEKLCVPSTDSNSKVMLCTLVFQAYTGFNWGSETKNVIEAVIRENNLWENYRIARSATRYGHHQISSCVWNYLQDQVSSEHFHFWLISLEELSRGEAILLNTSDKLTLIQRLHQARTHYNKAAVSLKAASTPAYNLQFQSDYTKLRAEFLECMCQLVHTCFSLCTTPPPAVASTIAENARDPLQRCGHVTNQLRKCIKDFRSCAELYWKLYQSAFDADPASLANIQILQHMCLLMAYHIEKVAQPNNVQDDTPLDFTLQHSSLETQHLISCCREANTIVNVHPILEETKAITHQHISRLLRQVEILTGTALCYPRYFFQVLQSTSIKLAISPQPRVLGEPIGVQSGSQLAVKVEGVIQHGKRPSLFRTIGGVVVTVSSQLQSRSLHATEMKTADPCSVLVQTVTPHRDFFSAQFLLAFPIGGQYLLTIEASVVDEKDNVWRTGPRSTLAVKYLEETGKITATNSNAGSSRAGTSWIFDKQQKSVSEVGMSPLRSS